ncbi:MAG: hypothetical protein JNL57_11940 [Bacteroidetes bacterium]|nr:hypothetical protein [Bacteroidota bacterium]
MKKAFIFLTVISLPFILQECVNRCKGGKGGAFNLLRIEVKKQNGAALDSVMLGDLQAGNISMDFNLQKVASQSYQFAGSAVACDPVLPHWKIAPVSLKVVSADSVISVYKPGQDLSAWFYTQNTSMDSLNLRDNWKYSMPMDYHVIKMNQPVPGISRIRLQVRALLQNGDSASSQIFTLIQP